MTDSIDSFFTYQGEDGNGATGVGSVMLAAGVCLSLIAQIAEQIDYLRFMPPRTPENARKWYDWALTPAAQAIGAQVKNFQVPANKSAPIPKEAPKLEEIKLIAFDFAKYGSSEERRRLLSRWDREVKSAPK